LSVERAPRLNQSELGLPPGDATPSIAPVVAAKPPERMAQNKIQCDACPVLCQISEGRLGACDRWGNVDGRLTRTDPVVLMQRQDIEVVATLEGEGGLISAPPQPNHGADGGLFVSGVASGTTYPDYKPAPFIVASRHDGVDMVTVVTEGIFSYCSFKVKIDTDRYLGPEQATVRHKGEAVGHVSTMEYGSQFLSLGGVHHLTGGSKKEGRATCELMMNLGNKQPAELEIEGGAVLVVQANRPPLINGIEEQRMRVGCGSATIGIFAQQWFDQVDEVVVVDDHITGVLTEHQAGRCLDMGPSGIRMRGRKSTPGRYFQVAEPGTGWGGTNITDPLSIIEGWDPKTARPGLRLLMVSTTGEDAEYFVLDEALVPCRAPMPEAVRKVVDRIGENCEPALATVLFVGGAGGSLRAGVTENPILLTRSIKSLLTRVTCGGAPAYIWPGGGITVMVDVARMPDLSFGSVPTPAIVAPIEFTMRREDYRSLGGHVDRIRTIDDVVGKEPHRIIAWDSNNPWPLERFA
jgi:6-hydroxynicotinate reductase